MDPKPLAAWGGGQRFNQRTSTPQIQQGPYRPRVHCIDAHPNLRNHVIKGTVYLFYMGFSFCWRIDTTFTFNGLYHKSKLIQGEQMHCRDQRSIKLCNMKIEEYIIYGEKTL